MTPLLENPSLKYKESYLSLVEEFKSRNEPLIPFPLNFDTTDFAAFLKALQDASNGIGLPDGFVAHSTYWLVDEGQVVAASNLRHHLTDQLKVEGGHIGYGVRPSVRRKGYATTILKETLKMAAQRGIQRCLVTCDNDNIGSAKTILKNGGILYSEECLEAPVQHVTQRYWIELKEPV